MIYPFIDLIENESYLTAEVQILLCGVIIENLGRALSGKGAYFWEYAKLLLKDVQGIVISDSSQMKIWAQAVAHAYNGIKHVEHVQMSVRKKAELLHEVKLMLKYWVAKRLGCDESIIKEHIGTHRIELAEINSIFPYSW